MALDTMGLIRGTDVLHKISTRLEESHLAYLQLDESPSKLQARHKLEGFIKEYLCHVPNEIKYVFQETADILHRSAVTLKDFSGYRACTAWRALSLYAANLLAQPWRKEYRTLKTYSGYYKHEIEAHLIGAELMFELMGYKHTGLGALSLEGPIDPDRVSNVSRDAIVAFVECQILNEIWESVSQNFTISWLEILEFRWNFVGTSDQAIRALDFRFRERSHCNREKISPNSYHICCDAPSIRMSTTASGPLVPTTVSYRTIANTYDATIMSALCERDTVYRSNGHFYFAPMGMASLANRCSNHYICRPPVSNYYPMLETTVANPMIAQSIPDHTTHVPTGRLIELNARTPIVNYEKCSTVLDDVDNAETRNSVRSRSDDLGTDRINYRGNTSFMNVERDIYQEYAGIEKRPLVEASHNLDVKANDWEFVYKSLEGLGYSKDLGDRDDVLKKRELMLESKMSARIQQKSSSSKVNIDHEDNHEKYWANDVRDVNKRITAGTKSGGKYENNDNSKEFINNEGNPFQERLEVAEISPFDLQGSIDDMSYDKKCSISENHGAKYSNTMPSLRNIDKSVNQASSMTMKNDTIKDNNRHSMKQPFRANRWHCATCTFLNPYIREICEMCGKSRRKGNEDKPLASGGKECPQCTLVNERNAANCEACDTSLKDSPTYI